ncbi:MAG TPA: sorbosone dehydrogenase family protein [Gemmatimonadaceae bacterium]|nr:sorbosone dehydrogenase family protein [Gemmatimonadaceae bacterium]
MPPLIRVATVPRWIWPLAARGCAVGFACAALLGCGEFARVPAAAGFGPHPTLPPPVRTLIPTINVAPAKGWPLDARPVAAAGTTVHAFAGGLQHPRFLYVLPNGDVLVAETNAPVRPDDSKGIRGWFFRRFQRKGGGGAPSANRITLLRDRRGNGAADTRSVFLSGLNSPFGIALIGHDLYVATTDAVLRYPYVDDDLQITAAPTVIVSLPAGRINHHWTKTVVASADGSKLYVSVGSNSNAAENGLAAEDGRAAIWQIDPKTGNHRIYASGLRNAAGLAIETETGALWAAVNERDELGSDLVPDYLTAVRDGGFYGWPYSYFGQHLDARVKPQRPDLVAMAIVPDYALGAHTASVGLASSRGAMLGAPFSNGMFVGQHGSWNRKPRSGYKVIFVPFADGRPAGDPIDVLTGFLNDRGEAMGRPVGVAIDKRGALLVADDVGNTVWRVTAATDSTR